MALNGPNVDYIYESDWVQDEPYTYTINAAGQAPHE